MSLIKETENCNQQRVYDANVEVKIWDISTKTIIDTARSFYEARNKLGVHGRTIERSCRERTNFYSPALKKQVACRLGRKEAATT